MNLRQTIEMVQQFIEEEKDTGYFHSEENVKNIILIPILQALNYPMIPKQIRFEDSRIGYTKRERVDCTILKDGNAVMLIEVKNMTQRLGLVKYLEQLKSYYSSTKTAKLAIITNGRELHFYADYDDLNIMDDKPFYKIDVLRMTEKDYEVLELFQADNFLDDPSKAYQTAKYIKNEIAYKKEIKTNLATILKAGLKELGVEEGLIPIDKAEEILLESLLIKHRHRINPSLINNTSNEQLSLLADDSEEIEVDIETEETVEETQYQNTSQEKKKNPRKRYSHVQFMDQRLEAKDEKGLMAKDLVIFVAECLIELDPERAMELPSLYPRKQFFKKSLEEFGKGYNSAIEQLSNGLYVTYNKKAEEFEQSMYDMVMFFDLDEDVLAFESFDFVMSGN
jgi:hypothetical protein